MLPDRVSNPGPLTYESGVLPVVLRGPATLFADLQVHQLTRRFPTVSFVAKYVHVNVGTVI